MTTKKQDEWQTKFRESSIDVWHAGDLPTSKPGEILLGEDVVGDLFMFLYSDGADGWRWVAGAIIGTSGQQYDDVKALAPVHTRRWMRLRRSP